MPGLKELEQFRNELSNLGNERQVMAERGEDYDELPFPSEIPQTAPDIAVDDLLSSLDAIGPDQSEGFTPPPQSDDVFSLLDGLSLGDAPTQGSPKPAVPVQPAAPARPKASGQKPSVSPAPAVSPTPKTEVPEVGGFDDILASLNLDDQPSFGGAADSLEPKAPEADGFDDFAIPENLLSGFADEVTESRKAPDSGAAPSIDSDFAMPSFDMTPEAEPSIGDFAMPSFDTGGFGPISDAGAVPDFSEEPPEELSLEPEPLDLSPGLEEFPVASAPSVDEPEELGELGEVGEFADIGELGSLGEIGDVGAIPEFGEIEEMPSAESDVPSFDALDLTPSVEMAESAADEPLFPGFSASGEPSEGAPALGGFDLDSFSAPSFDAGDIPPPGEPVAADDFSDFTIPADLDIGESSDSAASEPPPADGFDGFSLDDDILKGGLDDSAIGGDEFNIPGFSDFTSTPARAAVSSLPGGLSGGKKGAKKEVPLSVSDADFARFLEILASYPLNLRIAIEEFLSGDIGTDVQKMDLVHSILGKVSIHKIARVVGDYLSRMIAIPKDYEKKSAEEYEREKSSLGYVLRNRILPAAILFSIVAVLSACVFFLGWKFVYRPLVAEDLYNRGYAAIEDARYTQSLEFFDRAVRVCEKKRWYYKYAQNFRAHKQYISAEMMYERIIARFNTDKQGYLEYGEMLRSDLRNFEKAENVIKRRFLVDFVNDPDGLILLGDTYLDWAEEDFAKYEAARQTYATLIELYGPKDQFLARMMRYFIRTDNLKEVLPLKDHFKGKKTKIGADDLVELSGYLLQKRYEPKEGDSEALREKIDDLRNFLERALKAGPAIPEAHYNMGRFYIYNYQNTAAVDFLSESLNRFEQVSSMSPKRVLTHVDAFRLLGECKVAAKEYLDAQSIYAKGITLYEDQRANRAVKKDPRVGKLYADYADIDYFVSNDLDNALRGYSKAIEELWDTPSVRYRIGYIDYQKEDYEAAMYSFAKVHVYIDNDRNLFYAFGNTLVRRGDYYAAQGFYERLMDDLDAERVRKGILFPQARVDQGLFVEEYMRAANNFGVILNRLARRTGDSKKNARAVAMLSESARAWDALTRNPETMVRAPGANLAFLNIQNITHPFALYEAEIYADIPKTLVGEMFFKQTEGE